VRSSGLASTSTTRRRLRALSGIEPPVKARAQALEAGSVASDIDSLLFPELAGQTLRLGHPRRSETCPVNHFLTCACFVLRPPPFSFGQPSVSRSSSSLRDPRLTGSC
jgi:hypothetical protein